MDFLNKLLNYYNLSLNDYNKNLKKVTINDIPYISNFINVESSKNMVLDHMKKDDKILIYGDYDCDGIMATSILKCAFNKLNYSKCGYYIPSRYTDGYGLTLNNAIKFKNLDYKLIICVDNGVSQFEAIDYCIENNIDVIICDHHEIIDENLLKIKNIIHPYYSNLKVNCSGAYTSFILASALLNAFDEYLFSLATVSIISDLMVLKDENKNIVKLGLELINKNKFLQLTLLSKEKYIDESVIATQIAPKINSIGRMIEDINVNLIAKYFISIDNDEIYKIYNYIIKINDERKQLSNNVDFNNIDNSHNIIIEKFDVKEGIIGLIANKLMEIYKKPVIILCNTNNKDILKGSIRSKNGINVLDLLEETKSLLLSYGGHDFAGGISLKEENINKFKNILFEFTKNKSFVDIEPESIEIGLNEITKENFKILQNFSPFGYGNESPFFKVKDFPVSSFNYSRNHDHIITKISNCSKLVCFNYDKKILNISKIDFIGKFKLEVYNGIENIDFIIEKFIF